MTFASIATRLVTPVVYLICLIAWEWLCKVLNIPSWLLPAPTEIVSAAIAWAPDLLTNSLVTLRETVFGFVLALALSLPLSALIAFNPLARKLIYPLLLGLQSIPKCARAAGDALVRLLRMAEDRHRRARLLLSHFGQCRSRPRKCAEGDARLMRSLGAPQHMILRRLRLPAAMPSLFTGCKVAITFAVIGAVIGEFVSAQSGLGYLIMISTSQSQTPVAFAAILALTLLSVALFYVLEFLEKRIVTWSM